MENALQDRRASGKATRRDSHEARSSHACRIITGGSDRIRLHARRRRSPVHRSTDTVHTHTDSNTAAAVHTPAHTDHTADTADAPVLLGDPRGASAAEAQSPLATQA